MKRFFFLAVAATCLLASCNKTEIVPTGDLQEISFMAVNKTATKTPVSDNKFLDDDNMAVAAYIVEGAKGNFFNYTLFEKEKDATYWTGQPARYWPLTTSTINFLAVTENGGNDDDKTTVVFDTGEYASHATVTLHANQTTSEDWNQNDLMFAAGQGKHTQGQSYHQVGLAFKHALSWINFKVASKNPNEYTIDINSIKLNGARYQGTLELNNKAYASTTYSEEIPQTKHVEAVWKNVGGKVNGVEVPNKEGTAAAEAIEALTKDYQLFGNGLLVVPDGYAESFTINYTLYQHDNKEGNNYSAGTKQTYDYTYTLPNGSWEMAKKYFYNIMISLSEIEIDTKVIPWTEGNYDVKLNGDETDNTSAAN